MAELANLREQLRAQGIRDAADYAEVLVAEAVGGEREGSGVNREFDVHAGSFGRIEIKCRQLPLDGRIEERVELNPSKEEGFDYLAIVIFFPDFRIKGAVLVPYRQAWECVRSSRYSRISYSQACAKEFAIDITADVVKVATCRQESQAQPVLLGVIPHRLF